MIVKKTLTEKQAEMRQRQLPQPIKMETSGRRFAPLARPALALTPVRAHPERPRCTSHHVFDISYRAFQPEEPSQEFLDCLVAVAQDGPEYLRPEDARRYLTLLPELAQFEYRSYRDCEDRLVRVGAAPIRDLGESMLQWVWSCFRDERPLWATYALDAQEFVRRHAEGYWGMWGAQDFELKAMVGSGQRHEFKLRRFVDGTFKRDFTMRMRSPLALGEVPEGASVVGDWFDDGNKRHDAVVVAAGEKFPFWPKRCHLTYGNSSDYEALRCEEPAVAFDLMADAKLYSDYIFEDDRRYPWSVSVPLRWIIAEARGKYDAESRVLYTPWAQPKLALVRPDVDR